MQVWYASIGLLLKELINFSAMCFSVPENQIRIVLEQTKIGPCMCQHRNNWLLETPG